MRFKATLLGCLVLISSFAGSADASIDRFIVVNPKLVRGGQPTTEKDFQHLKKNGIRTVISLRTTGEILKWEKHVVEHSGMKFRNYPIDGMSYPSEATMKAVLRDLEDPALQPVFIHCHAGKDRTGLSVGLYRVFVDHWRPADAYEEMLKVGFDPQLVGLRDFFWDHVQPKKKSKLPVRRRSY